MEDELPNTLALLGGSLVRKLPVRPSICALADPAQAATAQWQSVQYTVGASEELVFTLQNRSYNVRTPFASRVAHAPSDHTARRALLVPAGRDQAARDR